LLRSESGGGRLLREITGTVERPQAEASGTASSILPPIRASILSLTRTLAVVVALGFSAFFLFRMRSHIQIKASSGRRTEKKKMNSYYSL
jgi:hypothetical protein